MAETTCSVDGCRRTVKARGWCGRHYDQWQKYGGPTAEPPEPPGPAHWHLATRWTAEERRDRWCREWAVRWLHDEALIPLRAIQDAFPSSNAYLDYKAAGGTFRPWLSRVDVGRETRWRNGSEAAQPPRTTRPAPAPPARRADPASHPARAAVSPQPKKPDPLAHIHPIMRGLFMLLPDEGEGWTLEEKRRWLNAVQVNMDLIWGPVERRSSFPFRPKE